MKRLDRDGFATQVADIKLAESRMGTDMLQRNPDFNPATYFKDGEVITGYNNGVNTDWWDLLTEDVPYIQNHNISVRVKTGIVILFLLVLLTNKT